MGLSVTSRHRPNLYFSMDPWVYAGEGGGGLGGGTMCYPLPIVRSPTFTIESLTLKSIRIYIRVARSRETQW